MNRSKYFGKKDMPLEKGQQTLTAFFSKAKSVHTRSKCPVCFKQVSTPKLATHQKHCTAANRKSAFSREDDDSDIEIIEDTKTPIKKSVSSTPNVSTEHASKADNGVSGSKTCAAKVGSSVDTNGSSSVAVGEAAAESSSSEPISTSAEAKSFANGAAVSISRTPTSSTPLTPCHDAAPPWGRGSPQILDVVGGGGAASLCETVWSHSDVSGDTSEPSTPQIRRKVVSVGGWLVSPTRSPSVSPSGRVMTSPSGATPGGPVASSSAVGLKQRVKLSPAVAVKSGRFAHSALLSQHLPPPTSPAPSRSPRQSPSRREGKSPGNSPWKCPGGSRGSSPGQRPYRRLPKTNPLRYLSSPSGARRRLYRTSSSEAHGLPTSTTGSTSTSTTVRDSRRDAERAADQDVADKENERKMETKEKESEGKVDGERPKPECSSVGGARPNGVLKLADVGLLRCDSQERLIGNFAVDSGPCFPISTNSVDCRPDSPDDCVLPSLPSESVDNLSRTPTPTPADNLNLSVEEEDVLSQEFSAEMPEVALLSPSKLDASQPYYLQNFLFVVNSVLADELQFPLLDDEDRGVISRFRSLPPPAQMLYMRMFQRKHAWLRPEKLRYSEVGDEKAVSAALDQLAAADLVDTEKQLNGAVEMAELLSAPELRQLCQQLHLVFTGLRSELLARIEQLGKKRGAGMFGAASPAEMAARRARTLLGRCVRVSSGPRRVLLRVLTLFHLPMYEDDEDTSQQLLTLLMVNLGRMVYPPVTVSKQTPIFATRDDLLRYEAASQIERQLRTAMETKQWEAAYDAFQAAETMSASLAQQPGLEQHDASLPAFLRRFTASSIITYVLSKSVEVLQRRREHVAAVSLLRGLLAQKTYLPDYRGFWADRLALTLHQHLRKPDEALEAVREALADPEVRGGRLLALQQRLARLGPELDTTILQPDHLPSVEIEARCLPRDVPGLKMVFICPERPSGDAVTRSDATGYVDSGDVTVCSVEELALSHYSSRYSEGVHREGAPTVTIFALLFWDLLYSVEVPDSFRSAYQKIPLDLNSASFFDRRREAVEARLTELESGTVEEACGRAAQVWEAHNGCLSLASWDVFRDVEHALSLIRCLGMRLVTAICRRLATEYRFTRSGFPDLVLWDPATRTARIVEVKGPNDRLSTKQMLWIRYLLDHGAEAEVCYVRALGRRGASKRKAEESKKTSKSPKKRRAAPADLDEADLDGDGDFVDAGKKEKKRGRPRKVSEVLEDEEKVEGDGVKRKKRGGRRKVRECVEDAGNVEKKAQVEESDDVILIEEDPETMMKKKRGRPRKVRKVVEDAGNVQKEAQVEESDDVILLEEDPEAMVSGAPSGSRQRPERTTQKRGRPRQRRHRIEEEGQKAVIRPASPEW